MKTKKTDQTRYVLITMIENDDDSINNKSGEHGEKRLYESEALLCFEAWRKNAGWLKDIPIYTYCPTKNVISEGTKTRLVELGVEYIENYIEETDTYFCGWWNVPLCGKILEKELDFDIFIHIDLDMNIFKPLPKELIDSVIEGGYSIVGQYDDYSSSQQRISEVPWSNPFDTGFIVSTKNSGFYQYWYEALKKLTENGGDEIWKKYCSHRPLSDLEEYVIDVAYNEKKIPIKPIQKYQIGEWYTPVSRHTPDELDNVYFWHEHLILDPDYDNIQERLDYHNATKCKQGNHGS